MRSQRAGLTNVPGAGRTMRKVEEIERDREEDKGEKEKRSYVWGELHFSAIFYTHLKSHTEKTMENKRDASGDCGKGKEGRKGSGKW